MMNNKLFIILILGLIIVPSSVSIFLVHQTVAQVDNEDPINPSSPTDVYIVEGATYEAPVGDERPIMNLFGIIYWETLADTFLNFFLNTSDVITDAFWDFETGNPFAYYDETNDECAGNYNDGLNHRNNCVTRLTDRYIIIPRARSFEYEITAYYDPDIIYDTGFIVIFNSQSVDFSITIQGEDVYAKVDYKNIITLPRGAGIVSFAPIEKGFLGIEKTDNGRWQLIWEYKHRALDSKHDPLIIEVTYSYDDIFLKFTEQVYQNQQEQKRRQEEENKLQLLNASFVVISTLALIASIFSVLFAYLLARKRFQPKLQQAKELPRRAAQDIEKSDSLKVPAKSLLLSGLIIFPLFFSPVPINGQIEYQNILWRGIYDLREDMTLIETVEITFPVQEDRVMIYINTSEVIEFNAYDEFNESLRWEDDGHRYIVYDTGFYINYVIKRPYTVHNNSQMLVYLDRFWLEFFKPSSQSYDDRYLHVDLEYTVILPTGAYLYSASPSELLDISKTSTGRWNVSFTDYDQKLDAFHDPFETQITFSFISILEAIENLDIPFQIPQEESQDIDELINVARSEILLFSILGIIAPLISFLIAYWIFRRRYQKLIERLEQQQEEQILIEAPQIEALTKATSKESKERLNDAYAGHYWKLINKLSTLLRRDISILDNPQISAEIKKHKLKIDTNQLMQLISMGQTFGPDDAVGYGELNEFAYQVEEFLKNLE